MKRNRQHASFIENLRHKMRSLKKMGPDDVHIFTVDANYGRYQIMIGPKRAHNQRNLEITGEIHHLFLSHNAIAPNPSRHQIYDNLKNTVIMRDLEVHLVDPTGDGRHLAQKSETHPREYINLAGKNGELLMNNLKSGTRLSREAYRIVQKDILHSIKEEITEP